MQSKKINPIIRWWMTPYLPIEDIFELPLLMDKSLKAKIYFYISHWLIHPIKRRLARWYLIFLKRFTKITVIAITGSAGKSTTTQILSSILKLDGSTVSTKPSIDPVFNIPNTILQCSMNTKYLILEMSVEFIGEMDYYLWLATPDIGVITNIYSTHIEYFKSREGVLKEKGKMLLALSKNSTAILNSTNDLLVKFSKKLSCEMLLSDKADDPLDQNSNLAKAVAKKLQVSDDNIIKGLKQFIKPKHRYQEILHKSGAVIFDDSYNNNPEAFLATLKVFLKIAKKSKKIVVIGDMLQLGDLAEIEHKKIGVELKKYNFEKVIGIGKLVKFITNDVYDSYTEAIPEVKKYLTKNNYILVKGSRSIGLDKLVDAILK